MEKLEWHSVWIILQDRILTGWVNENTASVALLGMPANTDEFDLVIDEKYQIDQSKVLVFKDILLKMC